MGNLKIPYVEFAGLGILNRFQIVIEGVAGSIHDNDSSSSIAFNLHMETERINYVVHLFRHMTVFIRYIPNNDGNCIVQLSFDFGARVQRSYWRSSVSEGYK